MARYCLQCGSELRDEAMFCLRCGAATRKNMQDSKKTFFDLGNLGLTEAADKDITDIILSPGKTFGTLFSRIGSGIRNIGHKPVPILPVLLLCVIWIILLICRRKGAENIITGFLSFISYGGDVSDRSLFGVLGTAVGRGTVAVAFSSLFVSGGRNFRNGLNGIFSKTGNVQTHAAPGWFVTGLGLSFVISRILEGAPMFSRVMAVVSLAVVSVQALGNEKSWLYLMARSVTSSVRPDRTRVGDTGAVRKILTGLIAGSVIMIPYSGVNSLISLILNGTFLSTLPVVAGVILIVIGIIMNNSRKKKI